MYFTIQIMCYLQIFDIQVPANAEIFQIELTKLVEFDILDPEGMIKLIS